MPKSGRVGFEEAGDKASAEGDVAKLMSPSGETRPDKHLVDALRGSAQGSKLTADAAFGETPPDGHLWDAPMAEATSPAFTGVRAQEGGEGILHAEVLTEAMDSAPP